MRVLEKTIDLQEIMDKLYYGKLYRVHHDMDGNQTHNLSGYIDIVFIGWQGIQYFSSVPVLHYLQTVFFIKIWPVIFHVYLIQHQRYKEILWEC